MTPIKLYTLPNCPKCRALKHLLEKEHRVFLEVSLDSNPGVREALKAQGITQAPVLEIRGKLHSFETPQQIKEALAAA